MANIAAALAALDGAASHEAGLASAFQTVANALGGEHFYLVRVSEDALDFVHLEDRVEMLAAYLSNDWAARDDWTAACRAMGRNDLLMTDAALIAPEVRRRSDFFQDFARTWRCGRVAAWGFAWAGERWGYTLSRDDAAGSFDAAECAAIRLVMANANRAAIAVGALADARRHGFADGLSRAGRAVVMLDQSGVVCFVSPAAERMFSADFGVRDRRLFAVDPAAQGEFDCLAAHAGHNRGWATHKAMFRIPRQSAPLPVLASASPVRLSALDVLPGARVLISLTELGASNPPSVNALVIGYGFTMRQAQIAQALACGEDLEAIAARQAIQMSTVRHHVKAMLAKTGANRLATLIARVKELPSD